MRSGRGSIGFVLLALPLILLAAQGGTYRYVAIALANVAPVVALGIQLRRRVYSDRIGWTVMGIGFIVLLVHNVAIAVAVATTGLPDTGSLGVATLVLGYVALVTGGMFATIPYTRRDGGGMLDATMIGFAAASLVWALVLQPAHQRLGSSDGEILYEMSLLLMISAMSGAVVRAAIYASEARKAALYLLLSITAMNTAGVSATLTIDARTGLTAWWVSALWALCYVALGAAALHPSSNAIAGPERARRGLTLRRLVLLGGALAVNPAVAGAQQLLGHDVDVTLLSIGSLLMVPLVVTRIGLLARWHAEAVHRLHELASLDELTGLPNRRAMTAHLQATLARVADGASPGAVVLYLDLDDFKAVNDEHGHNAGDLLLREVARRLRGCVRATDLVARVGGDEFVVVLETTVEVVEAVVVPAIERALADPVALGHVLVSGQASIGVAAPAPGSSGDAEDLLSRADAEMYRTKRRNRGPSAHPTRQDAPVPADL